MNTSKWVAWTLEVCMRFYRNDKEAQYMALKELERLIGWMA